MDKRHNLWQAVLIMSMILLGEVHTFWEGSKVTGKWIYKYPWSEGMNIQNYVKDNGVMIGWILFCVFAYRLGKYPTKFSFWLLQLVIIWKVVNIPIWWYNYKTFGYGWVYFGLVVLGVITWWWETIEMFFIKLFLKIKQWIWKLKRK